MRNSAAAPLSADANFTIALGVVAFLLRAGVGLWLAREPVWDGHYYHFGAERIAQGLGYSEDVFVGGLSVWKPWVHYPVGYSAFLAIFYRIFGSGLEVAPLANALVGACTVVLTFRIACTLLSPVRARIAGALVALHPGLIAYTAAVMTEGLASCLLLTAAWFLIRTRNSHTGAILYGCALGLGTLVRPTSLLALPLLAFIDFKGWKAVIVRLLIATAACLLVVSPWTIRNCVRMDGCALVSTNGGWNLAIGALTDTGRFRTLRGSDGCPNVTGQVQQDRCWAEVGLRTIAKDPARWLGLIPDKLRQTFNHESFIVEYVHEADPKRWDEALRSRARAWLTGLHWLLLWVSAFSIVSLRPFAAWWRSSNNPVRTGARVAQGALFLLILVGGIGALMSDFHPFWPFAVAPALLAYVRLPGAPDLGPVARYLFGLTLSTALVHAVFFGDDRYHLVITPVLCILAARAFFIPTPGQSEVGFEAARNS
ncbi:MAG: glycosyltransferase family 39 protein [Polyangiaceae bacterium]|nr:glycosyltransferase family 39 protein [Polyangiaceae bacterium]